MFKASDPQIEYLRNEWLPAYLLARVPLAVCSGNHDYPIAEWLSFLGSQAGVIGDGDTQIVRSKWGEAIVVTTCPYVWSFDDEGNQLMTRLWDGGMRLRDELGAAWLVLHHEPPPQFAPAAVVNNLAERIARYAPDVVASGHFHSGHVILGRFCQQVGGTLCLNSGQTEAGAVPNHIVLDFESRTAIWRGTASSADPSLLTTATVAWRDC